MFRRLKADKNGGEAQKTNTHKKKVKREQQTMEINSDKMK